MRASRVRHIFAYGTLMASEIGRRRLRERARIGASCTFVGTAAIRGRMYHTGPYPGVVRAADAGERVYGELWRLPEQADDLLTMLDRYEGCAAGSPTPPPYRRDRLRVRAPDGGRVTAWIYLWIGPVDKLPLIADGRWRSDIEPARAAAVSATRVIACRDGTWSQPTSLSASPRIGPTLHGGRISGAGLGLLKK